MVKKPHKFTFCHCKRAVCILCNAKVLFEIGRILPGNLRLNILPVLSASPHCQDLHLRYTAPSLNKSERSVILSSVSKILQVIMISRNCKADQR